MDKRPNVNHNRRKPLEVPIWPEAYEKEAGRFVSPESAYKIRAKILRKLSARLKAGITGEISPSPL
jgi:hypothetical protein